MRKLGFVLAAVAVVVAIFAATHRRTQRHGMIAASITSKQTSPLAPQLILTDLSGKNLNTANLRGQVVVVNFWAAWCTPCAGEVPRFIALQEKYRNQGLQIIGVSIDDSDSELRDFYRRYAINYPVVAGSQAIAQAYGGILGLPTTFIIDRDGHIGQKLTGSTDFAELEKDVVGMLGQDGR